MKSRKSTLFRRLAALLALSILLSGPALAQEEMAIQEEPALPGMSLPFDGSSVRSFEKSLEAVRAQTTEEEFTTLQNALDYLLVYDLAARRDKKLLYQRLDGKTPSEVIEMVHWQTGERAKKSR